MINKSLFRRVLKNAKFFSLEERNKKIYTYSKPKNLLVLSLYATTLYKSGDKMPKKNICTLFIKINNKLKYVIPEYNEAFC